MQEETSPTARALLALEALQARPGITAAALAERLDVSERAVRRYVAILREAGIAVESGRGPHGGYRLGRGLRLPPLVFTATEALGLAMAALEGIRGRGADDPLDAALGKLVRALPEAVGRPAAMLREHAASVPAHSPRPDPQVTTALLAATAEHRQVRISYRTGAGREFSGVVEPWAVVARHGVWYLLCHAQLPDDVRTYRLERIGAADVLATGFDPPRDLDPVALLEEHLARGWGLDVRVRFAAAYDVVRPWVRAPMGTLAPDGDGCLLVGSTSNPAMYAGEWLAGIPHPFVVEGGPELRDAVGAVAVRLAASVAG
jgi:predicted DNA-binding transcriptional regulator YafY